MVFNNNNPFRFALLLGFYLISIISFAQNEIVLDPIISFSVAETPEKAKISAQNQSLKLFVRSFVGEKKLIYGDDLFSEEFFLPENGNVNFSNVTTIKLLDSVNYLAISKVSYNLNNSLNYFKSFDPSLNIKIFSSYIANLNVMNINVNIENDIIRYILNYGLKNCTRMVNYSIQNLDPIYLDPIYCYDIDRTVLALPIEVNITANMIRFEFESILQKVFLEVSMSDNELITYSKANKKTYWLNYIIMKDYYGQTIKGSYWKDNSDKIFNFRDLKTLTLIKSFVFSTNLKLLSSINLKNEGLAKIEFGISPNSNANFSLTPENHCNLNRWTTNAKGYKNNFVFSSTVTIEGTRYNINYIEDYVNSVFMNKGISWGEYHDNHEYDLDRQFLKEWGYINDNDKLDSSLNFMKKNSDMFFLDPRYEGLYYILPEPQKSIILKINFVTTLEEVENQLRFKLKIRE